MEFTYKIQEKKVEEGMKNGFKKGQTVKSLSQPSGTKVSAKPSIKGGYDEIEKRLLADPNVFSSLN